MRRRIAEAGGHRFTFVRRVGAFAVAVLFAAAGQPPRLASSSPFVSPAEARRAFLSGAVPVDVRSPQDFEALRIPGSQNIPLFAVKTKAFLKPKIIVLLNNGFPLSSMEKESRLLRSAGWSVFILEGGLRRWAGEGLPLEGNLSARYALPFLSPADYVAEKDLGRWRVVEEPPHGKTLRDTLETEARSAGGRPLLVITENGDYREAEKIVRTRLAGKDVLYLAGGRAALRAFERDRTAMASPGLGRTGTASPCSKAAAGDAPCQ